MLLQTPCKSVKDSLRAFHCLNENLLRKNCFALTASNFGGIFAAANEALLAQGEDNKSKSTQKGCCEAVQVRLPSAQVRI